MTKLTNAEKDKLDNTCGNLRVTKLGTHVKSLEDFVNEGALATRANDVTSAINELYGMIANNECADIQIPPPGFFTLFGNDEDGKLYVYYNDEEHPPIFHHVETPGELEGTLYLYIADPEGENHFEMEIGHYIAVKHLDNYYTKAEIDAGYAIKNHASTANTYGLGSTSKYGHVKTINGLTQASHADGLALSAYQGKVLKTAVDEKVVTVEKQSTAESGYSATYIVKQNNAQVGVKINIPKDFLVKSTSVKTCTTANQPVNGYEVGDIYIDWVVNSKDNTATDEHLYLRAKDIGSYPPDEVTLTIVNNQFKIKDGGVGSTQLASDSVLTAKIKDANVTTAKIKDGNVTTAKIKDGNVTTAKIADSNVTTAKIADGAVTNDKVTSITKNKISDFSHAHGNLQNDGKVGTTDNASKNVVTDANGKITTEAKPTVPTANSTATNIKMDGTQSAGSLSTFAKADHVHPTDTSRASTAPVTQSANGLMSSTDKTKLDGIATGANKITVDSSLSSTSTNPVQNKVINTSLGNKVDKVSGKGLSTNDFTDDLKTKLDKSMVVGQANVSGTTSAYTATITGVTLTHGTLIALYNAVGANVANATLNVNSLGAKPIYYNASAIGASRYPNKAVCLFMYNTSIVSTGCWQLIYSYDSNTTYSLTSLKDSNAHSNIGSVANASQADINTAIDSKVSLLATKEEVDDIIAGDVDLTGYVKTSDSRLSDARTPTSHTHGNISNDGVISNAASKNVVTDANGKITTEAKPTVPTANSTATNIKMDGTQSAGSLSTFAKADHVHPTDTSRASTATASASANGLMSKEDKAKMDKSMVVGQANVGGTTSAYTATITGVTLTHGTIIALYNAVGANAASATLNVNSLGAKPIYYNSSAIPASRYPNKSVCLFMYNTSIVSTGCWQLIYSYDSNNTDTAASATPTADTASGAVGTSAKYAREDHVHPKSSIYAESSHTHTKSEISDFPTSMTPTSHTHALKDITGVTTLGADEDLNDYHTVGLYYCNGTNSRSLSNKPYSGSYMALIENKRVLNNDNYIIQTVYIITTYVGGSWYRIYVNGTWSPWKYISGTDNGISPTDHPNLDNLVQDGLYTITGANSLNIDLPYDDRSACFVRVIDYRIKDNPAQFVYPITEGLGDIYYRNAAGANTDGTLKWQPWQKIFTNGNLSKSDVLDTGFTGSDIRVSPSSNEDIGTVLNGLSSTYAHISHEHGNIDENGVISGAASKNVVTDSNGKITTEDKYTHPSYTARTGVPTDDYTLAFGNRFNVSQPVSDTSGHITAINKRWYTLPTLPTANTSTAGITKLVNDLTTGGTDKALTAEQGKTLNNKVTSITTHNSSSATTIKDSFVTSGWTGTVRYYIRNGWCIITYEELKKTSTTTGYDVLVDTQLNNDMGYEVFANTDLSNYMPVIVKINANNGKLMARCIKANTELYGSIVFPIS